MFSKYFNSTQKEDGEWKRQSISSLRTFVDLIPDILQLKVISGTLEDYLQWCLTHCTREPWSEFFFPSERTVCWISYLFYFINITEDFENFELRALMLDLENLTSYPDFLETLQKV